MENASLFTRILNVTEESVGSAGNVYLLTNDEAATWDPEILFATVLCATAVTSQKAERYYILG
jgi:hypothetical protein